MQTKTKRLNLSLSEETNNLIREIKKKTGLSLTVIVEKALEAYAKEAKKVINESE